MLRRLNIFFSFKVMGLKHPIAHLTPSFTSFVALTTFTSILPVTPFISCSCQDRYMSPDIKASNKLLKEGKVRQVLGEVVTPCSRSGRQPSTTWRVTTALRSLHTFHTIILKRRRIPCSKLWAQHLLVLAPTASHCPSPRAWRRGCSPPPPSPPQVSYPPLGCPRNARWTHSKLGCFPFNFLIFSRLPAKMRDGRPRTRMDSLPHKTENGFHLLIHIFRPPKHFFSFSTIASYASK